MLIGEIMFMWKTSELNKVSMMRFIIRTYAINTLYLNSDKYAEKNRYFAVQFNSFLSNFFFFVFFCLSFTSVHLFTIHPHSVHALHATRTLYITSFISSSFFSLSCQIILNNNLIRAGSRLRKLLCYVSCSSAQQIR